MAVKLNIGTKQGKTIQKEIEDIDPLSRKIIGDKINGDELGFEGYEFEITGGSDKSGFPMRKGIQSARKRILAKRGTGLRIRRKGMKKRKTVCGEFITQSISQINLKVLKKGKNPLEESSENSEKTEEKKEDNK